MVTMSDVAARYRRLADRFTAIADAVPPDAWGRPAPCEGWTARDVVAHVVSTECEFLERFDAAPAVGTNDDPVEAWAVVRTTVLAILEDPERAETPFDGYFGPMTFAAAIDQFYASDLVIHGWDLARATGLTELETLPDDEITRIHADTVAMEEQAPDAVRQPTIYGPAIATPSDADAQRKLLALLGRDSCVASAG